MFVYLRAVPWFAGADPRGGVDGRVVVDGGSGDVMMVPKGGNASGVRGVAWMLMLPGGIGGVIVVEFDVSGE